jgi:cephalosporin-C deacetylase
MTALDPMAVAEMASYGLQLVGAPDVDEFWQRALGIGVSTEPPVLQHYPSAVRSIDVHDLTFAGFDDHPIRGWVLSPRGADIGDRKLPCVVEFIGYGGGRGLPHDWLYWSACGFVHVVMDTRGQGSSWRRGDTPDRGAVGTPQVPGFLTAGLPNADDLYYRRLFVDAVRAVDAAKAIPYVDVDAVTVTGHSQGGALALAVAVLRDDIFATMPDVPFLCDIRRAADIATVKPFTELAEWLATHRAEADDALAALDHVDVALLAPKASAPAYFSVAMRDEICPPSTVYAAFNRYGGVEKEITAYAWNNHEGGQSFHQARQAEWLTDRLSRAGRALPA